MKKQFAYILCALLCALSFLSCSKDGPDAAPNRRVVIMYAASFSNLSPSIEENINQFCKSEKLPSVGSSDIFLVYAHTTERFGVYVNTSPVLFRAYTGTDGKPKRDTLNVYPDTDISGSAETLNKVLTEVQGLFPAKSYGLIFSSHGKGWIPKGYQEEVYTLFNKQKQLRQYPLTKDLGNEKPKESGMDIADFKDAIPMHLDFCILDACLMGCVEVAYELKDKCDLLLFSPTEILSYGMNYTTMPEKLLNIQEPDIKGVARDFYELYETQSGDYKSATVTLVDCRKLDPLADAFRDIVDAHRSEIEKVNKSQVQAYFYNDYHWFFDLRDLLIKAGATESEVRTLDSALDGCILYKAATEKFFDLKLENVCGLSVYIPSSTSVNLNSFYKTLAWNSATGFIL